MQLTKCLHAVKIPFQIRLHSGIVISRYVYVYLLIGKDIVLIDSGVSSGISTLLAYFKKIKRRPEDVAAVFLTHSHPDHIGGLADFKILSGCVVAAHPKAVRWTENINLQADERPVPGFHELVRAPVKIDRVIRDREVFRIDDNITLEAIETPGHSADSLSFRFMEEHALVVGDVVPVCGDAPIYEDPVALARSIRRLRRMRGVDFLCSSWDLPRRKESVRKSFDAGLRYIKDIDMAVRNTPRLLKTSNQEWAAAVLKRIGLPGDGVNPLVVGTFQAHVKKRFQPSRKG